MTIFGKRVLVAALLMLGSQVGFASAELPELPIIRGPVTRIQFDVPTLAPFAHIMFCQSHPEDCVKAKTVFRRKPLRLSLERWSDLTDVNDTINHAIRPQRNTLGRLGDSWMLHPIAGDCNDFAVTKRHELLQRGWPGRSLLLSEVVVPSGEHHLVLVVRTDRGDLVLDNLTNKIYPATERAYEWVRIQTTDNPRAWASVGFRTASTSKPMVPGNAVRQLAFS